MGDLLTLEQRALWLWFDARAEGTHNPIQRLYYRFRMRLIEWKSRNVPLSPSE